MTFLAQALSAEVDRENAALKEELHGLRTMHDQQGKQKQRELKERDDRLESLREALEVARLEATQSLTRAARAEAQLADTIAAATRPAASTGDELDALQTAGVRLQGQLADAVAERDRLVNELARARLEHDFATQNIASLRQQLEARYVCINCGVD